MRVLHLFVNTPELGWVTGAVNALKTNAKAQNCTGVPTSKELAGLFECDHDGYENHADA